MLLVPVLLRLLVRSSTLGVWALDTLASLLIVFWKPSRLRTLLSSVLARVRTVEFCSVPLSLIVITTVTRSPIRVARKSLKKPRLPLRHSELGWRSDTCGGGIGRLTGR